MFDVTPEDVGLLGDADLRELVGRLCEAELARQGLSPAAVTWGGNQTAVDGGLDVRVAAPSSAAFSGFIPRCSTGFQVKTPDMPRSAILEEMRPSGALRPVIQELANHRGAYIIVSSNGSTSDSALSKRRAAMREALSGPSNVDQLLTDFYDRTRLATWVRQHPGLIAWVKQKVGRVLVGWHPYASWSSATEGVDKEYLLDDELRLRICSQASARDQSIAEAIDALRGRLAKPRGIVRLVGLSGVGKTRLAQALFDARIGGRPLPPSSAVYTNLSDNPDPQPIGMASDLVANRMRAVLIVDNCPPDLHRQLSELCRGEVSTISLLTIEYDVRDDQPEGTDVAILDTSSSELIKSLVWRRYSHLSDVNVRSIADASGGNARIAIALAETVGRSETIAGLSNDELFERLFRQRHDADNALLLAAQTCSLVYSFQGETLDGETAELPRLALLAGQAPADMYRRVSELLRRELVQQRGVWRAVLPHAIANRLAARALQDLPYDLINRHLVEGGTERLARSFSRRLSFLHDQPRAAAIVGRWLASDGLLGDVTALNAVGRAMFENVAPVLPETTLSALERALDSDAGIVESVWWQHRLLLRSLAYDASLFERSARLLARAVMKGADEGIEKASDVFVSLFTLYLSGTHATIEQRLALIEVLLKSDEAEARLLGLAAMERVLEAWSFGSSYSFEFGARSRDFGYQPQTEAESARWYRTALALIERLALEEGVLKNELRDLLARTFRELWTFGRMYDELERLSRAFASAGFWREGWAACLQTRKFDGEGLPPSAGSRLSALEVELRPSSLVEKVQAFVLSDWSIARDLEDADAEGVQTSGDSLDVLACELGKEVAAQDLIFSGLLPGLLKGGSRVGAFGRGLASASTDPYATWSMLVEGLQQVAVEQRNPQVFAGFLGELWLKDRGLAQGFLDSAADSSVLYTFLPFLHTAVGLDERGAARLRRALQAGCVPVEMCEHLAFGRATDALGGESLKDLLLLIADQTGGVRVALEILRMRLFSDRAAHRKHEPELIEAGRQLALRAPFGKSFRTNNHNLAEVVKTCFADADAGALAAQLMERLKQATEAHETDSFHNISLLKALFGVQAGAVLDALFGGDEKNRRAAVRMFEYVGRPLGNPADAISCAVLIEWCNRDCEIRYPIAAGIVTFARRSEQNGPLVWSDQAMALLDGAPDPKSVLAVFIERFRPMSWSGSRAVVMEANLQLLDRLGRSASTELASFRAETKARLAQEIAIERRRETERGRAQDERFE